MKLNIIHLSIFASFLYVFMPFVMAQSDEGFNLSVTFGEAKLLPSMSPVVSLKVGYLGIFDGTKYKFNKDDINSYVIVKKGGNPKDKFQIKKMEVRDSGVVYLTFDSHNLDKTKEVNVGLKVVSNGKEIIIWNGKTNDDDTVTRTVTKVPNLQDYTLSLKPDIVPEQELFDGTKKTVGQLQIKYEKPSLITNQRIANVYFKTNNLISSNAKDKNSKLEFRLGAERTLFGAWGIGKVESKFNADQRFKNTTFVLSSGVTAILPWKKTNKIFFNKYFKAPTSPVFEFAPQYHRRFKQENTPIANRLSKNGFVFYSEMNWNPIQLFAGSKCEATDDDIDDGNKQTNSKCFSNSQISLELNAKSWYFPYQKTITGKKVRKFENFVEASLYIPLDKFERFGINGFKSEDKLKTRLKITYRSGANDAAGFQHSTQFLIGFEAIK